MFVCVVSINIHDCKMECCVAVIEFLIHFFGGALPFSFFFAIFLRKAKLR